MSCKLLSPNRKSANFSLVSLSGQNNTSEDRLSSISLHFGFFCSFSSFRRSSKELRAFSLSSVYEKNVSNSVDKISCSNISPAVNYSLMRREHSRERSAGRTFCPPPPPPTPANKWLMIIFLIALFSLYLVNFKPAHISPPRISCLG